MIVAQAITPAWSEQGWRRALARALAKAARIRWDGPEGESPVLVACAGECGAASGWHRVEWVAEGLTCDCPARGPCHHRARAWCEYMGEWRRLETIAREHGVEAAVRWLVYRETGELDATPIRPLRDVRLWREGGSARADVPHCVRHSPTGIEWGYLGSGPSDLAYSILVYFYGPAVAEELARCYLREVICAIPHDAREYVIPAADIERWVQGALWRPCPGPWTGFDDGSAPLCSCHSVPDAWLDEAYPTYDIEPGTPCGSVSCVCRYAEEE